MAVTIILRFVRLNHAFLIDSIAPVPLNDVYDVSNEFTKFNPIIEPNILWGVKCVISSQKEKIKSGNVFLFYFHLPRKIAEQACFCSMMLVIPSAAVSAKNNVTSFTWGTCMCFMT